MRDSSAGIDRGLVLLGSAIPLVFIATNIVCGFVLGDYNHLTRLVSELGALGTRSQHLFTAGLLLCSALSLLFVVGLCRSCMAAGLSVVPALVILAYTESIAGAALFPLPLRLHLVLGMPSILLLLSPALALLLWRRLPHMGLMAAISLAVMSLGFLTYLPDVLGDYPGLKQRFFHLGWAVWFLLLSYRFAHLPDTRAPEPRST